MGSQLTDALGESVRALVDAQIDLDQRAADSDRWDREGLPPVALAYTASRLKLTTRVRVHASQGADGALAFVPVGPSDELAGAHDGITSSIFSVAIRLENSTTYEKREECHDRAVDADGAGATAQ
jgi:hypothetical protein